MITLGGERAYNREGAQGKIPGVEKFLYLRLSGIYTVYQFAMLP